MLNLRFFKLALCEGTGVCPPLPANLEGFKRKITTVVQTVTRDMLQCVWEELKYRIDVCRVTRGAHVEHP